MSGKRLSIYFQTWMEDSLGAYLNLFVYSKFCTSDIRKFVYV